MLCDGFRELGGVASTGKDTAPLIAGRASGALAFAKANALVDAVVESHPSPF